MRLVGRCLGLLFAFHHLAFAQQPWTRNAARIYCGDNGTLPYAAVIDPAGGLSVSCEYPTCSYTDEATQLGYSNLALNTYYTGGYATETSTYDFISEITPTEDYGGRYIATVYRMQCPVAVAAPVAAAPFVDVQCFSGDTIVETPAGEKPIRDVDVGDLLLSTENEAVQFSRVLMHLHKVDDLEVEFVHVNGQELKLTDYHLVYTVEGCREKDPIVMYAKDLKEGWCMVTLDKAKRLGKQRVVSIGRVTERGYYAPLTATGDVVVNGVVASCHSNFGARTLQQSLLRFYSLLEPLVNALAIASSETAQWTSLSDTLQLIIPYSAFAKIL